MHFVYVFMKHWPLLDYFLTSSSNSLHHPELRPTWRLCANLGPVYFVLCSDRFALCRVVLPLTGIDCSPRLPLAERV